MRKRLLIFDQILDWSPKNIRAMTAKGIALRELGRNEEALVQFDRAIEFNSVNSFVWYNKAIALRNLGRSKEADESMRIVNFPRGSRWRRITTGRSERCEP